MTLRIILFWWGLFFLIQFLIFTSLVRIDIFDKFDFNATVRLQDHVSRRFDDVFSWFSEFGSFEMSVIIILVIFTFLFFKKKLLGGFIMLFFFGFFHIVEAGSKFFLDHPPPSQFLLRTKQLVNLPQFHVRSEFSYPSGHAGRTVFLSVLAFVFIWRNKKLPKLVKVFLIILILTYDVVMFISRIYLGEHWTSDVVGGTLLGIALGCFSGMYIFDRKRHKKEAVEHHHTIEG